MEGEVYTYIFQLEQTAPRDRLFSLLNSNETCMPDDDVICTLHLLKR